MLLYGRYALCILHGWINYTIIWIYITRYLHSTQNPNSRAPWSLIRLSCCSTGGFSKLALPHGCPEPLAQQHHPAAARRQRRQRQLPPRGNNEGTGKHPLLKSPFLVSVLWFSVLCGCWCCVRWRATAEPRPVCLGPSGGRAQRPDQDGCGYLCSAGMAWLGLCWWTVFFY